jgi:hypothetical protein
VPAHHELIDIANDNELFADLWYFTKFDNEGTYFFLDMNANYQCLITFGENRGENMIDVNVAEYSNCLLAPNTYPDVDIDNIDLEFTFMEKDYFMISEKSWNDYFASL